MNIHVGQYQVTSGNINIHVFSRVYAIYQLLETLICMASVHKAIIPVSELPSTMKISRTRCTALVTLQLKH